MAISYVDQVVGSSSPTADATLTYPGTFAIGDLLLMVVGVGDNDNVTINMSVATRIQVGTGWNLITGSDIHVNGSTSDTDMGVYYKYYQGVDSNVVVNGASSGGADSSHAVALMAFRGVKLEADGGPFDTTPNFTSSTTGTAANPPSHNWSGSPGVWTVAVGAIAHTAGAAITVSLPTNYTTNPATRSHDDTTDVSVGMGYRSNPANPEDPGNITISTTTGATGWAAGTLSLAPIPDPVIIPHITMARGLS